MLKLYKMKEEEKREMNFLVTDDYYSFKEDEEILGFAKINCLENVELYIFILEEKRGNGYGNELFFQSLEKVKEAGINAFSLSFPLQNVIMRKIVENYGGKEESRKENLIKYRISILL